MTTHQDAAPTHFTARRRPVSRTFGAAFLALLALSTLALGACSSSKKSGSAGSSSDTGTKAPEEITVPLTTVAVELPKMVDLGNQAAAAVAKGDESGAKTISANIEKTWKGVEGTVKKTDRDTYVAIEDAQAKINNGIDGKDAAGAASGATAQATAVSSFLAKHQS